MSIYGKISVIAIIFVIGCMVSIPYMGAINILGIANAGTLYASPNPPSSSNAIIDVGQTSVISTMMGGGIAPYNASWSWSGSNATTTKNKTNPYSSGSGALSLAFNPTSSGSAIITVNGTPYAINIGSGNIYGNWYFTANASDSTGLNSYVTSPGAVEVNPALALISLKDSAQLVTSGKAETLTTTIQGGTPPYTYIYDVYNSTGEKVYSTTYITSGTQNQFTFNVSRAWGTGNFRANVSVSDSASTKSKVNSSTNFGVGNDDNLTMAIKGPGGAQANSIIYGTASSTVTASMSGGSGPFTFSWSVNGKGITGTTTGNSSYVAIPIESAGNYTYTVTATDAANNYTATGSKTLTVTKNNTLSAKVSNPGVVSYYAPATVTFTGVRTINNQSSWALYVDGTLYARTDSLISWYEQAEPGLYTFIFNNLGNQNYTPFNITATLNVQQAQSTSSTQSSSSLHSSSTSTTAKTSSTTIKSTATSTYNTTATTTIKPNALPGTMLLNATYAINSTPTSIYIPGAGTTILLSSASPESVLLRVSNVTSLYTAPQNYATIVILDVNASGSNSSGISAYYTMDYPCFTPSSNLAVYILNGTSWYLAGNLTPNKILCRVKFSAPADPIIGLFRYDSQGSQSSNPPPTIQPAQMVPQGNSTAAAGSRSPLSGNPMKEFIAVAIVLVIIVVTYYMVRESK
ncbi:MAG: hypothetical protein KGI06_05220 [Candidatus Micrarchaeota archaeon]|nr:hypothetical protein [Candidatus Micrarchaeota archaeon]